VDDTRRAILARRARFVAAALAGVGCSPQATPVPAVVAVEAIDAAPPPIETRPQPTAEPIVDAGSPEDAMPRVVVRVCLSIIIPQSPHFDPRSHVVRPGDKIAIQQVIRVLLDQPDLHLELEGHCDSTEPDAEGLARAKEVEREIVSGGVAPARLTVKGAGKSKPIAPNTTAEGRASNRRVEYRAVHP
jgi:outer membrane protein OmpA-like peptidoglycan-associated protein